MNAITSSVGTGGTNLTGDVRLVQMLLNNWLQKLKRPPLRVDGIVGPKTIAEISNYQRSRGGQPDGRIDPTGPTLKALIALQLNMLYEGVSKEFLAIARAGMPQTQRVTAPTSNNDLEHYLNDLLQAAKRL